MNTRYEIAPGDGPIPVRGTAVGPVGTMLPQEFLFQPGRLGAILFGLHPPSEADTSNGRFWLRDFDSFDSGGDADCC